MPGTRLVSRGQDRRGETSREVVSRGLRLRRVLEGTGWELDMAA